MPSTRPLALITGASGGIGLEFARQLAHEQYDLLLIARRSEALEEIAMCLQQQHGITVYTHACDLQIPDSIDAIMAQLQSHKRCVDILINNAGFGINDTFAHMAEHQVLGMIQLNIVALTHLTHQILPNMVEQGSGKILNVSSIVSFQPCPYFAVYGATKAYVQAFSEALQIELTHSGVSVTALCPGATATDFHHRAGSRYMLGLESMNSARQVAQEGLQALQAGQAVRITGWINHFIAMGARLLPRRVMALLAGKVFKKSGNVL